MKSDTDYVDDTIEYQYGLNDQVSLIRNSTSEIRYSYLRDNLINHVQTVGLGSMSSYPSPVLDYAYDANGNETDLSAAAIGQISYTYDSLSRITNLMNSWGDAFGFGYDTADRLLFISRPGSQTNYNYSDSSKISEIQHFVGGTIKSSSVYTYDQRNYIVQKSDNSGVLNYGYDLNGQLRSVAGARAESFSYDSIGNRTSDLSGLFSYDLTWQRLNQDSQFVYSYDLNGNLIGKNPKNITANAFEYSYSSKNQLIEVRILSSAAGQVQKRISYAYDAVGRRIEKRVNNLISGINSTRRFVYDKNDILAEYDESGNLLARYTHSRISEDDVLAANITQSGVSAGLGRSGSAFFLKNALGSVTSVMDSSGNLIQSYQYDSFGKIGMIQDGIGNDISLSPILNTSFTFTGREWDKESGLYFYRARFYDPNTGRFLQKDPHPGAIGNPISHFNKFSYVANNPINLTDPSGMKYGRGG